MLFWFHHVNAVYFQQPFFSCDFRWIFVHLLSFSAKVYFFFHENLFDENQ